MKVNWERLARAETNPLRLEILEAIEASSEPMSAKSLEPIVGAVHTNVSYHVQALAKVGMLTFSHSIPRRGALEKFYVGAGD
jgi:predicted transcriptional regulator